MIEKIEGAIGKISVKVKVCLRFWNNDTVLIRRMGVIDEHTIS